MEEARLKESGVEAPLLAQIMLGMPEKEFTSIRWRDVPSWSEFQGRLRKLASDLIRGDNNSIFQP